MRHSWQLIEEVHESHHIGICVRCGLTRKAKKNNRNEYLTSYSGGYQAYRHVPPCEIVWEEHNWIYLPELPWQKCSRCDAAKLHVMTPDGTMVWFKWDEKWTQDYKPCLDI